MSDITVWYMRLVLGIAFSITLTKATYFSLLFLETALIPWLAPVGLLLAILLPRTFFWPVVLLLFLLLPMDVYVLTTVLETAEYNFWTLCRAFINTPFYFILLTSAIFLIALIPAIRTKVSPKT